MARKHLIYSYQFFDGSPVTVTAESNATVVAQLDYSSVYITWDTSDLVGTVEFLAKNGDNSDFYALDFGSAINITGASGSHQIVFSEMPFTDLKMRVNVTGGSSGNVSAVITAKSEGA